MNIEDYQEAVERTMAKGEGDSQLANWGLGLTGEAGEVADIVKKYLYHGHTINYDEMVGELGDVL